MQVMINKMQETAAWYEDQSRIARAKNAFTKRKELLKKPSTFA